MANGADGRGAWQIGPFLDAPSYGAVDLAG